VLKNQNEIRKPKKNPSSATGAKEGGFPWGSKNTNQ
jgi:hypothetical protein